MKALYAKLLLIQAKLKPVEKSSENPHFHNKYFDINTLLAEVKPILTENGVIVLQPLDIAENRAVIRTLLIDAESGEEIESATLIPEVSDPQKFGAAVSYYRRYALTSLLAIEGEDTDAEAVVVTPPAPKSKHCIQCGNEFMPDPKYPYSKTCSYACALKVKASN
jgi:hypothetical protein